MDRELTEDEKVTFRRKYGRKKHDTSGSRGISYRAAINWAMLTLFLFTPTLLDYGIEAFGGIVFKDTSEDVLHLESQDEAILRVYAARTWGIKGIFAVHSWIAMKRKGSRDFEVSQVIGWRQGWSGNVLFRETGISINTWWGNEATLLLDLRGAEAETIIEKVDVAIEAYPWSSEYSVYPGPTATPSLHG